MTALKLEALSGAKPELPLSCVKRVMEQAECAKPREIDEDAALCLESACQLLVRTITARSWAICTEDRRDTVQATDVIAAFEADDRFASYSTPSSGSSAIATRRRPSPREAAVVLSI